MAVQTVPFPSVDPGDFPYLGLKHFPSSLNRADMFRYCSYSDRLLTEIDHYCRGDHNRIGFALLYSSAQILGWFLRDFSTVPRDVVEYVATQVRAETPAKLSYPVHMRTWYYHCERVRRFSGLSWYGRRQQKLLMEWLVHQARAPLSFDELLGRSRVFLYQNRILLPGATVLRRAAQHARREGEEKVLQEVAAFLSRKERDDIDQLLDTAEGHEWSRLTALQRPIGNVSAASLNSLMDDILIIRALGVEEIDLHRIPSETYHHWARRVPRLQLSELKHFNEIKRQAVLALWLRHRLRFLIDTGFTMFGDLVRILQRRSENAFKAYLAKGAKKTPEMAMVLSDILDIVRQHYHEPALMGPAIVKMYTLEEIEGHRTGAAAFGYEEGGSLEDYLARRWIEYRKFSRWFFKVMAFTSDLGDDPLLEAIAHQRDVDEVGWEKVKTPPPTAFIEDRAWQHRLLDKDQKVNRWAWELALGDAIRRKGRHGGIRVEGSQMFQTLGDDVQTDEEWFADRVQLGREGVLPETDRILDWILGRQTDRRDKMAGIDYGAAGLSLSGGTFHVSRAEAIELPPTVKKLSDHIAKRFRNVRITEVFTDILRRTGYGFLVHFTHVGTGKPIDPTDRDKVVALLTVLLAQGMNVALDQMARCVPGMTEDKLRRVLEEYVRPETLQAAVRWLVDIQSAIPVARYWGDTSGSVSDGKRIVVTAKSPDSDLWPPEFGPQVRVVNTLSFISDQHAPFGTQVIPILTAREAAYLLDTLLFHGTRLRPKEHFVDSHGFSLVVMAFCYFFGIRLVPRLKGLPHRQLWLLDGVPPGGPVDRMFKGRIRPDHIRDHWDMMMRMVATIYRKRVQPSLLIRKVSALPPENLLLRAWQDLGRLLLTLHVMEYAISPAFRWFCVKMLNMAERRNSMGERLFWGRSGELTKGDMVAQLTSATALNLLILLIVTWNTFEMDAIVSKLTPRDWPTLEEDMSFITPMRMKHITYAGEYRFNLGRMPQGGFIPQAAGSDRQAA